MREKKVLGTAGLGFIFELALRPERMRSTVVNLLLLSWMRSCDDVGGSAIWAGQLRRLGYINFPFPPGKIPLWLVGAPRTAFCLCVRDHAKGKLTSFLCS